MIRVYRECQPYLKSQFLQKINKLEQMSESLSLPMSINMIVIEVLWVYSILSRILGLYSDKYVIEIILGFILNVSSQSLVSQSELILMNS